MIQRVESCSSVILLFEHNLGANASRLPRGKPVSAFSDHALSCGAAKLPPQVSVAQVKNRGFGQVSPHEPALVAVAVYYRRVGAFSIRVDRRVGDVAVVHRAWACAGSGAASRPAARTALAACAGRGG